MKLSNFGIDLLRQVLDASTKRHQVAAQNVANVNTPGYKRLEVAFEGELKKALDTSSGMTSHVKAQIVESDNPARVDGNTVDLDQEMNELVKNGQMYQAMAQVLSSRIATMRSAITGQ